MKHLDFDRLERSICQTMEEDLADCRIGGASVQVFQEGHAPYAACFGYRCTEKKLPMQPDTIFRLASMTKPVTAAAVLLQIQRGKLDLQDPVSKYIPSFADKSVGVIRNGVLTAARRAEEPIRVLHLLTHTSGILASDEVGLAQPLLPDTCSDLKHAVDFYGEQVLLSNAPMGKALYSPFAAFDVAARLVELTSGMPYGEFLRANFFDPMGMTDTGFVLTDEQWSRMTEMHDRTDGGNAAFDMGRHTFEWFSQDYTCGGASLTATVGDYARFAEMLLGEGMFRGQQILTPDMVKLMRTPFIPETVPGIGPNETWGLGVRVITGDPVMNRGSFGWSGAYGTHFWVDPGNRLYAVYAKNSRYDGGSGAQTARRFEQCVMGALNG